MDSAWCGSRENKITSDSDFFDSSFTDFMTEFPDCQEFEIAEEVVIQNPDFEGIDTYSERTTSFCLDDAQSKTCLQTMKTCENICLSSDDDLSSRSIYSDFLYQDPELSSNLIPCEERSVFVETVSNSDDQTVVHERPSVIIAKDSTHNCRSAESSKDRIHQTTTVAEMGDTSDVQEDQRISEDIQNLLATHVSKDYANCVWTSEPSQKNCDSDLEKSPKTLVIADATSPVQQDDEASKMAAESDAKQEESSSDQISDIPTIIKKRKRTSKQKGNNKGSVKKNPMKAKDKLSVKANVKVVKANVKLVDVNVNAHEPSELEDVINPSGTHGDTTKQHKNAKAKKKMSRSDNQLKGGSVSPKPTTNSKCEGDITASSDDSIFKAYKSLVVNRSLPPYSPKQTDTRFFSGTYFTCQACNDKYIMQGSLDSHLARKTGKFLYNCRSCQTRHCFDNRCSLLVHILSHGMNVDAIKPGDLTMPPVCSEGNECDTLFKNSTSNNFKCHECSKMVSSLKLHLNGEDALDTQLDDNSVINIKSSLNCKECSFVLPSKCAFSAHVRFHKGCSPYVCPECGVSFLKASTLLSHMEQDCLHNCKRTIFQCGYCKVVVISIDLFTEHLISKHLRPTYVCHICGVSTGAFEEFNVHRATQHKLQDVTPTSGTAVLCAQVECDKCPGVNISLASLQDHAVSHTLDPKFMTTILQCKDCQKMFASKKLMLDHISACKGKTDIASSSPNEINFSDLPADIMYLFQPSGSRDVTQAEHVIAGPGPSADLAYSLSAESSAEQGTNLSSGEGKENLAASNGSLLTLSPENNTSEIGPSKEILLRKNVICKLCRKVVSAGMDKKALKKHFQGQHLDIFMNAILGDGTCKLPMQVVYSRSGESGNVKERKEVKSLLRSLKFEPKIEANEASKTDCSARLVVIKRKMDNRAWKTRFKILGQKLQVFRNDGFKCYKCSFSSENSETFKTHIISHKSNPTDLQCPNCGLCFIVRPPLEKHLIVEHGVKNVGNYLRDHGFEEHTSDDEGGIVNVEESDHDELQENQCKVCKETFNSALLLEKHFRVHGGAFLLANLKAKRSNQP